jgi:hypothetical protein
MKASWMIRYNELTKFKAKHGHLRIASSNATPPLKQWVKTQRWYHKKKLLSAERSQLLDKIGFPWTGSSGQGNTLPYLSAPINMRGSNSNKSTVERPTPRPSSTSQILPASQKTKDLCEAMDIGLLKAGLIDESEPMIPD